MSDKRPIAPSPAGAAIAFGPSVVEPEARRARRSTAVCRLCAPSALVASLAGAGGSTCSAVPVLIKRVMAVVTGVMSSVSRSSIALILIDRVAVIYEITGGERGYGWNFRLILAPSADSPLPHMPPTPKHPSPGMSGRTAVCTERAANATSTSTTKLGAS